MSLPIALMTPEEAKAKHDHLKSLLQTTRTLLLEMRDRKGYLALGFSNFEEYGEKEFGLSKAHINRLAVAAEVQQSLSIPMGDKELPERQLRELAKVDVFDRDAIYQQAKAEAEAEGKKLTAQAIADLNQKNRERLERAQMAADNAESNYKELNNRFEHYVKQGVEEKLPELQQQIEAQLSADFQARIDNQTDIISNLKNDLLKAKNDGSTAQQLAQLAADIKDAEQQLQQANSQLDRTNQTIAEKIRNIKIDEQINQGYINAADALISGVAAIMATLEVEHEDDGLNLLPLCPINLVAEIKLEKAIAALETTAKALTLMLRANPV